MGTMHNEEEELALNAKAIGLAVGGAIVAGLLFVLARRDDNKSVVDRVGGEAEAAIDDLKRSGKDAKKKHKALKKAAEKQAREAAEQAKELIARAETDAKAAERDMKAAAWDALQEAQAAEGRLRSASSRVAEDAAHLASRLTHEARSLADEGRGRIGQLRHRDELASSAEEEIARLREELEQLRERSAGGKGARRELSALAAKVTRSTGLDQNSVAADALAAGLDHLERSVKAKAPTLLAAKDRRQLSAVLQSELGPVLRDSLIQGATAALSSWEGARAATSELPKPPAAALKAAVTEAPRQMARVIHRSAPLNEEDSTASKEAAAEANASAEGAGELARQFQEEIEAARISESETVEEAVSHESDESTDDRRGKAGLLWGAAGLGLGIYALADPDRREQFLKLANEATVLAQELLRDLQGYDDEFA